MFKETNLVVDKLHNCYNTKKFELPNSSIHLLNSCTVPQQNLFSYL